MKDTANLARAAGDEPLRRQCQQRILALNSYYEQMSDQAGLGLAFERTYVAGFGDAKAENYSMMSSNQSAERINATPIQHSKEELASMVRYADEKGIRVHEIESFDGDIAMLREQIDAIAEIRDEYGLHGRLAVKFGELENPNDLAKTNQAGDLIRFSNRALRDKQATNHFLWADNYLASNDSKGIAYHEMGHVISKVYGNCGLDIAAEAYYNLTGKAISRADLLDYLESNVSQYSTYLPPQWIDKPFKRRHYKEIIPELLSKDKTDPTAFSREFIRLLKRRCGV